MTSRNSPWRPEPFLLRPVGKDYLWGGSRLNDEFAKGIALEPLAETWECSTHPDGLSIVASGPDAGQTLLDVLRAHPSYLGLHPRKSDGGLPLLVKLIDAKRALSVQVHPDDAYAGRYENGQSGKTEMWYILDAAPGASVVCGLRQPATAAELRAGIAEGTIEPWLQRVPVRKDDVFYIEAGTIHAIGAGVLLAEIQESSNLTYRLYDYGRERALHVDKALAVANLRGSETPRQPLRVLRYRRGCASELLCRCAYFEVHRLLLNTERRRELVRYVADGLSFRVLLCIGGCGAVRLSGGESLLFFKGDCLFFPAQSAPVELHGIAQFLDIRA